MQNLMLFWQQKKLQANKQCDYCPQVSYDFKHSPKVFFVTNNIPITYYHELPPLQLSSAEQRIVAALKNELSLDPHYYDGDHFLITDVTHDAQKNCIYLEAKRVTFSVLKAISLAKFPKNSPIYRQKLFKVGVLVPFITNDGHTAFVERAKDKVYSSAAGYIEPLSATKRINFDTDDLVVQTAINEIIEEFLGDAERNTLRTNFSLPEIKSISFRQHSTIGTVEFVAPCYIDCHKGILKEIILNNKARDKHEHTQNFFMLSLKNKQRYKPYPGAFLYKPMIKSSTMFFTTNTNVQSNLRWVKDTEDAVVDSSMVLC